MNGSTKQTKVFISYSWTSPTHEQWVLDFAERLTGDGVWVVLDKWDLKEGQDKPAFMEQMVSDEKINKVLVICDKGYQTKADERTGGVGTETQLISKKVYENAAQEKFIPIIKEYDDDEKPCTPHFIANRMYIDLSSDEVYEENYKTLIRNLFDKPLIQRPALGTPPAYIVQEEQVTLKTSHKVAGIKNAILNDRRSAEGLVYEYLETFLDSLEDFRLSSGADTEFDEQVYRSIEKMLPLREDFIEFIFTLFKYKEKVDLDRLHKFLEKFLSDKFNQIQGRTWSEVDTDNYKFFIYELVLYFISILFQLGMYREAAFFINTEYFYRYRSSGELHHEGIEVFNQYAHSLDETRKKRLNLSRVSITADLIKSRATRKDIKFTDLIQTDLVLFYIIELKDVNHGWFPRTSTYNARGSEIELFERLVSCRHFEKIKSLFAVENKVELRNKINQYIERNKDKPWRFGPWDYNIVPLGNVLKPDNICKIN